MKPYVGMYCTGPNGEKCIVDHVGPELIDVPKSNPFCKDGLIPNMELDAEEMKIKQSQCFEILNRILGDLKHD